MREHGLREVGFDVAIREASPSYAAAVDESWDIRLIASGVLRTLHPEGTTIER